MKVSTLPEWPQLHFWYFPQKRYETGIVTEQDEGGEFRIYEIEKTIVDILYYRNKIGIEETGEILKNYLFRNDRNLPVLHRYEKFWERIWRCFCEQRCFNQRQAEK